MPRPLWLLIPAGLLTLLVIVVPVLIAIYIALTDLDQYTLRKWISAPFIGIQNVVEAVTDSPLLHSIWLSVSSSVIITLVTLVIGIAAALAVNNPMRGRATVRAIYLIPYILPAFVTATVWRALLEPNGAVNSALKAFGIDGGSWLTGERTYWTLVLVTIWASWPFIYLLALSGLQSVTADLHEAASLDGVNWHQKLRYIVLPQLRGPIALAAILAVIQHLNQFTVPFVLFGNPAPDPVNVLPLLTYSTSFATFRFGLGSAMAIASVVLMAIPMIVYLRAAKLDRVTEGA